MTKKTSSAIPAHYWRRGKRWQQPRIVRNRSFKSWRNGSEALGIVRDFDVNNHDLFSDAARVCGPIWSRTAFNSVGVRDVAYEMVLQAWFKLARATNNWFYRDTVRLMEQSRFEQNYSDAALATANQECRTSFPDSSSCRPYRAAVS
jgi:hypothetical protein